MRTVRRPTRQAAVIRKQTGGISLFAAITLLVEPADALTVEDGAGMAAEDWQPTVDGVQSACAPEGAEPVVARVTAIAHVRHEVDSRPFAFRMAGHRALTQALEAAGLGPVTPASPHGGPVARGRAGRDQHAALAAEVIRRVGAGLTGGFSPWPFGFARTRGPLVEVVALTPRGSAELSAVCALVCPAVGRLLLGVDALPELVGRHPATLATRAVPPTWTTDVHDEAGPVAERILADVNGPGLTWFGARGGLCDLLAADGDGSAVLGFERRIAVLWALGERARAAAEVEARLAEHVSPYVRRELERLRARLG